MALAPDIVAGVARRLADHAGLELPAWVVEARATARIAALGVAPAAYLAQLAGARAAAELEELIEAVRVGESRLFRHRSHYAALAAALAAGGVLEAGRAIRVWSAGCAAGQEPYSLAVVLARALPGHAISIIATDISAAALAEAQAAAYPAAALADVPEPWRDAFVVDGELARVRPELAALVRFERANLLDGFAPRGCDVVWCRNVLIYFTAAARRRAIERLVGAAHTGGLLFVGYSESLRDVPELEPRRHGDAVYYVKRGAPARRAPTPAAGVFALGPAPRVAFDDRTPPPVRIPPTPPPEDVLALRGTPTPHAITAELAARLAIAGLRRLIVDLDGAELLDDELAPILRRARAAAVAAGIALELRAARTGARRWLARHALEGA